VPERRESATLDLDVVGVHTARAPLASQAQYVGLRRHCSASHRLRGAQPACQRRRAAPAIRAPASQLCVSRRGASAHSARTRRARHLDLDIEQRSLVGLVESSL